MIDEHLLESARIIRNNFTRMSRELENYTGDIKKLVNYLEEKIVILKTDTTNKIKALKDKSELPELTKTIIREIEDIELEEKKLQKKVSKINEEMEKLQKEEEILYQTIKQKYPELTDNEIIKQIHRNLDN